MNGTILIVDRREPTRRSLAQRLTRLGHGVREADGVESARRLITEEEIEVVVLDLASLGEEGLLLLPLVRRCRPAAETILLARSEQVPLSIRGMKLGAFDDVPIPVDVDVLADRVAAALDRSRTRSAPAAKSGRERE